jgi:hypothetical protein
MDRVYKNRLMHLFPVGCAVSATSKENAYKKVGTDHRRDTDVSVDNSRAWVLISVHGIDHTPVFFLDDAALNFQCVGEFSGFL